MVLLPSAEQYNMSSFQPGLSDIHGKGTDIDTDIVAQSVPPNLQSEQKPHILPTLAFMHICGEISYFACYIWFSTFSFVWLVLQLLFGSKYDQGDFISKIYFCFIIPVYIEPVGQPPDHVDGQ